MAWLQPVGVEPLDGLRDLTMERAPPVLKETPVGDVVGQGVLERVLKVREESCLVEELGGLEVGQASAETLFGSLGDGLEEREWHVLANDGGSLQKPLVLG